MVRIKFLEKPSSSKDIMVEMEKYINQSSINKTIRNLIKIRASQINQCAFCLNMHSVEAMDGGESEQRILCLNAWKESPFYTDDERAALTLTEHITLISSNGLPDSVYDYVREYFNEEEFIDLIMIINQINNWNRVFIAVGNRPPSN